MTTPDSDPEPDAPRRKFDDVASLFGTIVPPAGTPVRPPLRARAPLLPRVSDEHLGPDLGPKLVPPPVLRKPVEALSAPPAPPPPKLRIVSEADRPLPEPLPAAPVPVVAPAVPPRVAEARPRAKAEAPWPDAFVPRPNYRSKQRSSVWYWLFLIPFAAVVAAGVTLIDPRTIRNFVEQTLPQYLPAEITRLWQRPTPAPAPIMAPAPVEPPAPAPAPPAAPAASEPTPVSAPPAAPPDAAPPAAVTPAPAAPTEAAPAKPEAAADPVPVPPPQPAAPPAAPAAAAPVAPPSAARVVIYYRRNQAAAEAEARQIASKIGSNAEIRAAASTARSPSIYYFNPADKDAAAALARTLADEGMTWIVRAGTPRPNPGTVEILLP